jgi:dimethylhistidine N-methyltransferase
MAIHGTAARPIELTGSSPLAEFRADVLAGLKSRPKTLPCKYFYDDRGSRLFDQICELPEYYLTRTEVGILRRHAGDMAAQLGDECLLIEYGSGSSVKTPLLLERLRRPAGYVPVDISREHLLASAAIIERNFPMLEVLPTWADFTNGFAVPPTRRVPRRRVVFFPGSTIGNLSSTQAIDLMRGVARRSGPRGGFLVGVDLWKSPAILWPAYNDAAGVSKAFNKNLLVRMNRELGADFELDQFDHYAHVNEHNRRMEMYLVSERRQAVSIAGRSIPFAAGEEICTEHSNKYTLEGFQELARAAGLEVKRVWLDDRQLFSVQYLEVASGAA